MPPTLPRRAAVACWVAVLAGCAPTPEQQAMALQPSVPATEQRGRDTRRFDTADRVLMLNAAIGVLQDLGFAIEESQAAYGIVVGSRIAAGRVRAQVVVAPSGNGTTTAVRVTFQRMMPRPGAMLPIGETIREPEVYAAFFEKLAQSVFLTAHAI